MPLDLLELFVLFRFFDILKPWPIRAVDRSVPGGFGVMLDDLLATALSKGINRDLEFQADLAAVEMAYRAGYDPQQLPKAIVRIEQAGQAGRGHGHQEPPQVWTALHPPTRERLARIQRLLVTLPGHGDLALGTERFRASR